MDVLLEEIKDKARVKTLNPEEMRKEMKEICRQKTDEQQVLVDTVTQLKNFVQELDRKIVKMPDMNE